MFESGVASVDSLEQELVDIERSIGLSRARQAALLRELDQLQVTLQDGARTLRDWTVGRLDVGPETAQKLIDISRAPESVKSEPDTSFDRMVATTRLAAAGAVERTLAHARGIDIEGVNRMAGRHRRVSIEADREWFDGRYLTIQPSLDESSWRLSGRLHGLDGRIVDKILNETAEAFPKLPDGTREPLATRRADALTKVCQDHSGEGSVAAGPMVTVFVDARDAVPTNGEAGAWMAAGPRVGPATLDEIRCTGTVEVTAITDDGTPLAVGTATSAVSGRTRRHVLHRDGGACSVDGCRSLYRLQPHHVQQRLNDGNNDPDNLTTLCWFHHHVVIHGKGFALDPDSPPQRRRFLRRTHGPP